MAADHGSWRILGNVVHPLFKNPTSFPSQKEARFTFLVEISIFPVQPFQQQCGTDLEGCEADSDNYSWGSWVFTNSFSPRRLVCNRPSDIFIKHLANMRKGYSWAAGLCAKPVNILEWTARHMRMGAAYESGCQPHWGSFKNWISEIICH